MCKQVDLRHMDEQAGSNIVSVGVDLSEFYMSVEWDILEVPAVRYVNIRFILRISVVRWSNIRQRYKRLQFQFPKKKTVNNRIFSF